MLPSKVFRQVCLTLVLIGYATGIDFKKNACTRYSDYPLWFWSKNCYYNPDILSEVPTLIKNRGYPVEGYTVKTADGYVLMMFRIPPLTNKRNMQPVYLQNGILTTAATWVNLRNRSLAFHLADQGYDVWLGSVRGSRYSKVHDKYRVTNKRFWDFSLDELATNDFRDELRFIAQKTGKAGSIISVGHSMGTTVAFMYAASYPDEAQRMLRGLIALAPGVYYDNVTLVSQIQDLSTHFTRLLDKRNTTGLFYQKSVNQILTYACTLLPRLCIKVFNKLFGDIEPHSPPEDLLLITSYFPDGVSIKVLKHYQQMILSKEFKKYDYGPATNDHIYGQSRPPAYDLSLIKLPVFLYYGTADPLVNLDSMKRLWSELGSLKKEMHVIPKDDQVAPYNHIDMTGADDIQKHLFPEVFTALQELSDSS